jgi:hypothetical protein
MTVSDLLSVFWRFLKFSTIIFLHTSLFTPLIPISGIPKMIVIVNALCDNFRVGIQSDFHNPLYVLSCDFWILSWTVWLLCYDTLVLWISWREWSFSFFQFINQSSKLRSNSCGLLYSLIRWFPNSLCLTWKHSGKTCNVVREVI